MIVKSQSCRQDEMLEVKVHEKHRYIQVLDGIGYGSY